MQAGNDALAARVNRYWEAMLKIRIITAFVLLLGFTADLFFASIDVFALVLSFVVAAAAWEWSRLCGLANEHGQTAFAAIVGLLALVVLYIPFNEAWVRWVLLSGFLFWGGVAALFYLAPRRKPVVALDKSLLILGIFLITVAAVAIQYLRSFAPAASSWLLFYAFTIVWLMDIGAYFSGRRFGKHKLAPSISPGKTWEGVYGGVVVAVIMLLVILATATWTQDYRLKLVVATVLAAAASVLGDLYESRMKRAAGMKDSSQMLPGHGGVLDRIDGVLAAMPVFGFVWAWL